MISTECIECPDVYINIFKETNVLFSYYTDISEYSEKSSKVLTQSVLHHLTEWHRKVINFTKGSNKQLLWRAAFNEYLESIHCGAVELAFLHLITAIEALLLEDSSELKYRLSLYAAVLLGHNYETRNKIFNTLKKSYDIRSKVVHGDIKGIQNKIKSEEIYNSMFELRSVTSELLSITYGKDKKDVINKIQESLLKCPDITL